jgi:hypothetical protein
VDKKNLRVKAFYGTSPNAVKTQIWIAMTVYLLLAILKERYRLEQSLSQLLHFLEVNLFEQKPLISIFQANARPSQHKPEGTYKQLTLFDLKSVCLNKLDAANRETKRIFVCHSYMLELYCSTNYTKSLFIYPDSSKPELYTQSAQIGSQLSFNF